MQKFWYKDHLPFFLLRFIYLFMVSYIFTAAHKLSLVAASRNYFLVAARRLSSCGTLA